MARFTNQAQLAYNNSVTNSNIAVGEIVEVLSVSKNAVGAAYGRDDNVTYVISIVNTGTTPYTALTVTDDLGSYESGALTLVPLDYVDGSVKYFVNGVLQAAPTVASASPLVFSGITIPAGGNATIVYEAKTNSFAPLEAGSTIENTAVVSTAGLTPISASATITVNTEPELTITKSISPVPVTENGTLTYTFLIQNTGNTAATAADNAVITDTFNPILTGLNVTFNGAQWSETTDYTYNDADGLFTSVAGKITVPAATYTVDPTTGATIVTPGFSTLVISGVI